MIWIFSLPRSGSTFLQGYMVSKFGLKSLPETWFFTKNNYHPDITDSLIQSKAHDNLYKSLKKSNRDLFDLVHGDTSDFVEKTPRNLMCSYSADIGGDDKIIVLIRNPIAVFKSIANSWNQGRVDLRYYWNDFKLSARNIELLSHSSPESVIYYEDFVNNHVYLDIFLNDLGFSPSSNTEFVPINVGENEMGDKVGQYKEKRSVTETFDVSSLTEYIILLYFRGFWQKLSCYKRYTMEFRLRNYSMRLEVINVILLIRFIFFKIIQFVFYNLKFNRRIIFYENYNRD